MGGGGGGQGGRVVLMGRVTVRHTDEHYDNT